MALINPFATDNSTPDKTRESVDFKTFTEREKSPKQNKSTEVTPTQSIDPLEETLNSFKTSNKPEVDPLEETLLGFQKKQEDQRFFDEERRAEIFGFKAAPGESVFDVFNLQRFLPESVQRGISEGQRVLDVVTKETGLDIAAQKAIKFTGKQLDEIGEFFEESAEGKFVPKEGFLERPISNIAGRTLQAIGFLASPVGGVGETLTGIAEGDVDEKAAVENLQTLASEVGAGKLFQIARKLGGRAFRKVKQLIGARGERLAKAEAKISDKPKDIILELLSEKGKKAETKAFKEGRVITPKSKISKFLFGEKIDASDFDKQVADFVKEDIPDISPERSKAISQIKNKVDEIDVDVTSRASKINVKPSEIDGITGKFSEKSGQIAKEFPLNKATVKKHSDIFNSIVEDLKSEVTDKGNLSDIRSARIKWDNSFDQSIKNISSDKIVGKPSNTQAKWNLWMKGREELNESFFDIAAKKGDDSMRELLKKMSLGIRSVEQIAKSGKVDIGIIKKFRRELIGSGLTILGLGAFRAITN